MKKPLFTAFAALFIASCSTDLEVNAPYKEVTIVYGLLNPNDSVHYVKINKGFLGPENAYVMAANPDSSQYGDVLTVEITEENHPQQSDRKFILERVPVTDKSPTSEYGTPGDFPLAGQFIYKFSTHGAPLHQDARYSLNIVNNQNGQELSAITEIVNELTVTKPSGTSDLISFGSAGNNPTDYEVSYRTTGDARRYAAEMVMTYIEVNIPAGDSTVKTLRWNLGEKKSDNTNGSVELHHPILAEQFYGNIINSIPALDGNTRRYLYKADFYFWVADEELNTYMEVNEPSTGIIQEKPVYTNIENGFGIFASRRDKIVPDRYFNRITANILGNGPGQHEQYGNRFTHWYGQSSFGQVFQFIELN